MRLAATKSRINVGSSLMMSLCTTMPLLTAVTPQSAYQKTRVFFCPRISMLGDLALGIAGDRDNLPVQRRRGAGRIDIGDADFVAIELAAFDEGRPLLELGAARRDADRLAFQILQRLDVGVREHHHGSRILAVDRRHGPDVDAFRHAEADNETVGKAELRRLAGDELRGAAGAFARADVDVETDLAVEALVLRDHEAAVRPLEQPVEPHVTSRNFACASAGRASGTDMSPAAAPAGGGIGVWTTCLTSNCWAWRHSFREICDLCGCCATRLWPDEINCHQFRHDAASISVPRGTLVWASCRMRSTRSAGLNRSLTSTGTPKVSRFFCIEIAGRDNDDRNVAPPCLLLQGGDHGKAVHLGHHQIEQDSVWLVRCVPKS